MSMIPRSLRSFAPPIPPISSSLTLLVRVMVALRVWGLASVPISSSPCNMIHSVVSSRSLLLAKLSLPSIVRLPSAGGLTSRTTSLPFSMVTVSPATGTLPVWPGGRIRPVRRPGRRRSGILSLNDSEHAARAGMRERARQEGTSDIFLSWHQPHSKTIARMNSLPVDITGHDAIRPPLARRRRCGRFDDAVYSPAQQCAAKKSFSRVS